ncbi:hypothetical protein ROLI_013590 [Roseobacter fucihabitans]|uniref:Uncharacterized protein n=2 Tax=Roseobacter fucihabitans TaxID=1537242 RepID=A0ABZ2BTT2_9RHOB|nr:hypothetical protein [Roseobacter litoralis]
MCPVTYYYGPDPSKGSYPLSSANLHALLEIRELLSQLTLLEAKQDLADNPTTSEYQKVQPFFKEAGIELLYQPVERLSILHRKREMLSPEQIRPVLECLQTDKRPLWQLVEAIDLIVGLFQNADSSSLGTSMYYYSQMEWRITRSLAPSFLGVPMEGELHFDNDELENRIDSARMSKAKSLLKVSEIYGDPSEGVDIGQCYLVIGSLLTSKKFRDYVDVIICPAPFVSEVRTLISGISERLVNKVVGT